MSNTVDIKFNNVKIGRYPVSCLKKINEINFKKTYMKVLSSKVMDMVSITFSNMLRNVSVKSGGIENTLIDSLKKAISIEEQIYTDGGIAVLSFDVLDAMLKIRGRNVGWWRVLESKNDTIINQRHMFISTRKNRQTPSVSNKFGEGFLVSRERYRGNNFKPHSYSIKDKRYVTKFIKELTKNTIDNEQFMDAVMRMTVISVINGNNSSGDKDE